MYLNIFVDQQGEKNSSEHLLTKQTIPARTQIVSQLNLTKPIPSQRGHKMHLIMY